MTKVELIREKRVSTPENAIAEYETILQTAVYSFIFKVWALDSIVLQIYRYILLLTPSSISLISSGITFIIKPDAWGLV